MVVSGTVTHQSGLLGPDCSCMEIARSTPFRVMLELVGNRSRVSGPGPRPKVQFGESAPKAASKDTMAVAAFAW
jgi:hypothetical protein